MFKKIGLGTVQFGLDYGITNSRGKIPNSEIEKILLSASNLGISTLDTASAYGESERILGDLNIANFNVYTKIPKFEYAKESYRTQVRDFVMRSLKLLKIDRLEGLYLHDPKVLVSRDGELLFQILQELKSEGLFLKLGISIYSPEDYFEIESKYPIDLIQFPLNLFDQRFANPSILHRWKSLGIELHARSVFLQGILLKANGQLPLYFHQWEEKWKDMEKWRTSEHLAPLESCLYPSLSIEAIDRVLVGVDSLISFQEIMQVIQKFKPVRLPDFLSSDEPNLLFPYLWQTS